jgi:hypothetical protein
MPHAGSLGDWQLATCPLLATGYWSLITYNFPVI